jgi:hypothetical protein
MLTVPGKKSANLALNKEKSMAEVVLPEPGSLRFSILILLNNHLGFKHGGVYGAKE